ncbi:MAG: LytTR family DNA-binding domain-containing protein [Bacteroidota bacterium]
MKTYHCVVIDDDAYAIKRIVVYIAQTPWLVLIGQYRDPQLAITELKGIENLDIVFLDVNMPGITGMELAPLIRNKTKKLVFVTAHTKYAYEAFKANADDYLLKPYTLIQFLSCLDKLFPTQSRSKLIDPQKADDFFFVRSREETPRLVRINFSEIIMVESKKNYILIYTTKTQVLTYMSLQEISRILCLDLGFIQLQRSYIVKMDQIVSIEGNCVRLLNGANIIVGELYRKTFGEFVERKFLRAGKIG